MIKSSIFSAKANANALDTLPSLAGWNTLNGKALERKSTHSTTPSQRPFPLRSVEAFLPAVTTRIHWLDEQLRPTTWISRLTRRFCKQIRQHRAERDALLQFGHSPAVWEIAYLHRKQAAHKLPFLDQLQLQYLTLFHDSPQVLRITELKLKEHQDNITSPERHELNTLQRNPYREGIPHQLLDMLWPTEPQHLQLQQL